MRLVAVALAGIAGQLGNPHGRVGELVARWLNVGNRYLIEAAVAATAVRPGQSVADIGFGGGVGLSLLLDRVGADGTVHGVDISPDMVARLESRYGRELEHGRLRLQTGSLTELPFPAASLDALITVNTLYFVADLDRACTELRRVLRPGGTAVVGVGEPEHMARVPFAVHVRVRPVAEVTAAMERAGLTVAQSTVRRWPIDGHCLAGRAES